MKTLLLFTLLFAPIGPGMFNEDHPALSYVGSWVDETNIAYAVSGSARSTSSGSVNFDVYGTGFRLFFLYAPGSPNVEVCIDLDCVNLSTDGVASSGRADFTDLQPGPKQITVTAIEAGTWYFDGVYVYPDSAINSPQIVSEPFFVEGTEYTGTIDLSFTAGEIVNALLLAALVGLLIVNTVFTLWNRK